MRQVSDLENKLISELDALKEQGIKSLEIETLHHLSWLYALDALKEGTPSIVIKKIDRFGKASWYPDFEKVIPHKITFENFVPSDDYVYCGEGGK